MHNIEYFVYDENIKRDWVQATLDNYVRAETYQEGGHGLGQDIRWLDSLGVCANREEAENTIKDHDRKWYDILAVRYYQPDLKYRDKKLKELKAKEAGALEAYNSKNSVWAEGLKSEFVGCRNCGSRLKREYVHTNRCPICRKDLRPEGLIKGAEAAYNRYKKAEAARYDYTCNHAKKSVKWLVKIEYHT